jgi:hypothetical protein
MLALATVASLLIAICGCGNSTSLQTYLLTVNSSNPSSGVTIGITPNGSSTTSYQTTAYSRAFTSGTTVAITASSTSGSNYFSSWSGCASASTITCTVSLTADTTITANYGTPAMTTPTVTVLTSSSSINTGQGVTATITVAAPTGGATPTGTITLSRGSFTSAAIALSNGRAQLVISANALTAGSDALQAVYTPDSDSAAIYSTASGAASITVTTPGMIMPTVTVTPTTSSILTTQSLTVTIAVSGGSKYVTPQGKVTLSRGSYTSNPTLLISGSATITIPADTLATGSDTLVASYAPNTSSATFYNAATGASSALNVISPSTITVDQSSTGATVSEQLLGMNLAYWYDLSTTAPTVVSALQKAGIKGVRWPGGSAGNEYHWATNTVCTGETTYSANAFHPFISNVVKPGKFDLALTVNYSTNATCNGPGDPAEAAAWVKYDKDNGSYVSYVTVGNENWGSWEKDLHTIPYDPTTYANAVASGFYPQIKAANSKVLVGISVDPSYTWDSIVLAQAKYDFVEFHFYPQGPGGEDDKTLLYDSAQKLTSAIKDIRAELTTAGVPNTPIFIGEVGSVFELPGKQTTSITQALYAGQVLGEMMNEGVSRAAWWLGFGGCTDSTSTEIRNGITLDANFSSSLYGWQDYGGYMVFSDGLPEFSCPNAATVPVGTLLPTAHAFELFSDVAVKGEKVLTATVTGDPTDVRAYAATHSGGTALVVFNLHETIAMPLTVELSGQSYSSSVILKSYSKALYDQSKDNVWADPVTTDMGTRTMPITLTLAPWSMNVLLIK